jgi:acetyl esterase
MRAAGVPTTVKRYDGMIHGFFGMGAVLDQARVAMEEVAAGLQAAFCSPVASPPHSTGNPLKKLIRSFRLSR